jgi:pimeloyl-ACP methyl ester carboxylesterase
MVTRNQIKIKGKSISYLKAGDGQDLILFLHGSGMSAENWLPQLENEKLKSNYSLIAIDLPGHGKTEWLSENAFMYHPKEMAQMIRPLLDQFRVENYLLVGLSLGTNIIGEITSPLSGCRGIMLASPCIVNDQNPPGNFITAGPHGHVIVARNPSDEDLRAYVYSHMKNTRLAEQYITDYKNTDPAFREELGKTMMNASSADELANIQAWNLPVCVVFGKNDSLLKIDYLDNFFLLWNNKVYVIENAGHLLNEEQPEEFNSLLLSYAEEQFK